MQEMTIGQGECMAEGGELAMLSIGPIGKKAMEVVEALKAENRSVALYNMRFVKPLDEKLLHEIGKKFSKVITLENGVVHGGFGSAVLEFFSENNYSPKVKRIGLPDEFIEHGSIADLHHLCGFDTAGIEKVVRELLAE
jgi:1-deoxy-D-xylulose-5-phosphate synthase